MPFFQQFMLGLVQGIFEWLPVSSEGVLLLVQSNLFNEIDITLFLKQALLLHLGTFFAALIYFRRDIKELFYSLLNYKKADFETKKLLQFLIITTIISGVIGLAIFKFMELTSNIQYLLTGKIIMFIVGFFLLITGFLQLKAKSSGNRTIFHFNSTDNVLLGFMQGIAVLPGLSRSGLTVSSLLFRNFDNYTALRVSFLMSLPIVLFANIFLNFKDFVLIKSMLWALFFSFIFGLITIHLLMKVAEKVKFGGFIILVAVLMIIAAFI